MKIATANPETLAKVDAVLNGTDNTPPKADTDCRMVTFTEAAQRLNLSHHTIYKLVKMGRLATVPIDGVSRIRLQ